MRQSNRTLSVITLLLAVAMLLAACGGETPTPGATPTLGTTTGGGATTQTTPTTATTLSQMTPTAAMTSTTAMTPTAAMTSTMAMTPTTAMAAATPTAGTPPTNTPVPPVDISAAACSTAAGVDMSQVKKIPVEDGATLRVSGWGNPSEQKVTRDMLCRFALAYTNVKVTYEPLPDDYDTKIKTQISAGSEPDVFYVDPPLVDLTVDANKLLELTSYMSQAGVNKSDYFPALINIFSRGDKVYG
ncbi:MAG: hypothetical protein DLM69_05570, partial [Candidatus Chloroheliales bacterium]